MERSNSIIKIHLAHPNGNQFVRQALIAFDKEALLGSFHTSFALFKEIRGLGKLGRELNRRLFPLPSNKCVYFSPNLELSRLVLTKFNFAKRSDFLRSRFSIDSVNKDFDRKVSKRIPELVKGNSYTKNVFFCYEDCASNTLERVKEFQCASVYDLPIGYYKSLHNELKRQAFIHPQWNFSLNGLRDSKEKTEKKDKELSLCDIILTASSFTKETLVLHRPELEKKIRIIPYGFPTVTFEKKTSINSVSRNSKLNLLFVGSITQRKGIAEVLSLKNEFSEFVNLTLVGKIPENCPSNLRKEILKNHWIETLPHSDILKLMRNSDLLLFPSVFEGFGLVISEAMSCGLPVLTTTQTMGRDFLNNNVNGFLTVPNDILRMKEILEGVITKPIILKSVSDAAIQTALKRPWYKYRIDLVKMIKDEFQ